MGCGWRADAGARADDRRGEAREKYGPGLVRVQSFGQVSVGGPSSLQVIREGGDDRALAEQEPPLQEQRRLVVENVAPPVPHHELRQEDGDDVVLPAGVELVDVAEDRAGQLAVRGVDDLERDVEAVLVPQRLELLLLLLV